MEQKPHEFPQASYRDQFQEPVHDNHGHGELIYPTTGKGRESIAGNDGELGRRTEPIGKDVGTSGCG